MKPETESKLQAIIRQVETEGYERGLREGISRLEMIAAVVPSSVPKRWAIEQAGREAKVLWAKIIKPTSHLSPAAACARTAHTPGSTPTTANGDRNASYESPHGKES